MGLFGSKPTAKQVSGFGSGKRSSAKAAAAWRQREIDDAATKKALAERRAAQRKAAAKRK